MPRQLDRFWECWIRKAKGLFVGGIGYRVSHLAPPWLPPSAATRIASRETALGERTSGAVELESGIRCEPLRDLMRSWRHGAASLCYQERLQRGLLEASAPLSVKNGSGDVSTRARVRKEGVSNTLGLRVLACLWRSTARLNSVADRYLLRTRLAPKHFGCR